MPLAQRARGAIRRAGKRHLIDSSNPKVKGLDGATASFLEPLYALAIA